MVSWKRDMKLKVELDWKGWMRCFVETLGEVPAAEPSSENGDAAKELAQLRTQVAQRELSAGLQLLTPVVRIVYDVYDLLAPVSDGTTDKVFISESFDPTSHFETAIADVTAMYKRITGSDLVLTDGPQQ